MFANSLPSALNFKKISLVGQNNFGNKIPFKGDDNSSEKGKDTYLFFGKGLNLMYFFIMDSLLSSSQAQYSIFWSNSYAVKKLLQITLSYGYHMNRLSFLKVPSS